MEEKEDMIILSTVSLDVTIQRSTGEIAFLNKKGTFARDYESFVIPRY
ncbi:hypothetical protein [uncultured Acetobacterium sp.]|nr:hypothetical protein [uncultured Acetobacterium sp.]